ncbi:MAG: N-acetylmuramoyl-L-alanine amidase, partial [Rikenellaceae bacterium]|nr:N-acetylmuramoyl-L-alanine amidase [Rikenellaceae bacterium]
EPKPEPKVEPKPAPKQEELKLYDKRIYGEQKSASKPTATKPTAEKAPSQQPAAEKSYYTVQVMASKRALPLSSSEFKSYRNRVHQYEAEGAYRFKYGVGKYKTRNEALEAAKAVKNTFPGAFVVAVKGN